MKKHILIECVRLAKKKKSSHNKKIRHRHFSFIVQNNKILARGVNIPSNPPKEHGYSRYQGIHSEIDVYKKAKGIINHNKFFEVINIRINKRGQLRNSMPCKTCYDFLKYVGCRQVHFSTSLDNFAKLRIE